MIAYTTIVYEIAVNSSTHPYTAVGTDANSFSPIQAVANGTSDSQNSRCVFAHMIRPLIRSTVWIGPDGRVQKHWARVSDAAKHPERVLAALEGARD